MHVFTYSYMYIHVFTYSTICTYTYSRIQLHILIGHVYIYTYIQTYMYCRPHICVLLQRQPTKVLSHIKFYFTLMNESFRKCVGSRKLGNEIGAIPCTSAPWWNSRCNTARLAQCADCRWRQPGTCMFTIYVYFSKKIICQMNSYIYVNSCLQTYVCVHICIYR